MLKKAKIFIIARFSLFHSPISVGGAFISDSLSCYSEVHTSAQMFVILKCGSSLRVALRFVNEQRRTSVPRSFCSGCLGVERSGVFPSHSCAQVEISHELVSELSMRTASYTLCWRHQVAVVLIGSSEEPQVSSYTQIAPVGLPFERVVLRVACVLEATGFDR